MKTSRFMVALMIFALVFSGLATPISKSEAAGNSTDAISQSTYYSVKEHKIVLNEQEVLSINPAVETQYIEEVKTRLAALTNEEVDQILLANGFVLEEVKIDTDLAHANIVWYIPVLIGMAILATGALIFTALYFNHKEKTNLINKCYANGGYPVIDSRDKSGVKGTTNSGSAKAANGYKFECRKK